MNIIRDWAAKIKVVPRALWDDLFVVLVIVLVAFAAFGLGRLSALEEARGGLEISYPEDYGATVLGAVSEAPTDGYVASKSGSKYHLPWCPGAQSIKEENKIYFDTKEQAKAAGYTPASNCKGI